MIAEWKAAGLRIVATTPSGGTSMYDTSFREPCAVLLGGEGAGLPAELADEADARVSIPMRSGIESLNAAVAAALLLYEARRQRVKT
jgi:TrmH family RNA methyltransferase